MAKDETPEGDENDILEAFEEGFGEEVDDSE